MMHSILVSSAARRGRALPPLKRSKFAASGSTSPLAEDLDLDLIHSGPASRSTLARSRPRLPNSFPSKYLSPQDRSFVTRSTATPVPGRKVSSATVSDTAHGRAQGVAIDTRQYSHSSVAMFAEEDEIMDRQSVPVPKYLNDTYWWAYVHPKAVQFFERQWLVNAILWGNFSRLRDWALQELSTPAGQLRGSTLQVACVYGDLTPKMAQRLEPSAVLTVVDVVQAQLDNLQKKLASDRKSSIGDVRLLQRDASNLDGVESASYDQVLLFFLLHEMPDETRRKTLAEAVRVVKPGGKIVLVDYHRPHALNPLRMIMYPVLAILEPFAMDIWKNQVSSWLPESGRKNVSKEICFGGLYQKLVVQL